MTKATVLTITTVMLFVVVWPIHIQSNVYAACEPCECGSNCPGGTTVGQACKYGGSCSARCIICNPKPPGVTASPVPGVTGSTGGGGASCATEGASCNTLSCCAGLCDTSGQFYGSTPNNPRCGPGGDCPCHPNVCIGNVCVAEAGCTGYRGGTGPGTGLPGECRYGCDPFNATSCLPALPTTPTPVTQCGLTNSNGCSFSNFSSTVNDGNTIRYRVNLNAGTSITSYSKTGDCGTVTAGSGDPGYPPGCYVGQNATCGGHVGANFVSSGICTVSIGLNTGGSCSVRVCVNPPPPSPTPEIVVNVVNSVGDNIRASSICRAACNLSSSNCRDNLCQNNQFSASFVGFNNSASRILGGFVTNLNKFNQQLLLLGITPVPGGGTRINNCYDNSGFCYVWPDWNTGTRTVNFVVASVTPTFTPAPTLTPLPPTPTSTPIPFVVTGASATVSPASSSVCSQTFTFNGTLTANTAGTAQYHWDRSNGTSSVVRSLTFTGAGTLAVVADTWAPGATTTGAWSRIVVTSPNSVLSNQPTFNLTCPTPVPPTCTAPATLTASCPVTGNGTGTLTWSSVPGVSTYAIRVDDSPPSWNAAPPPVNAGDSLNDAVNGTSYNFTTQAGHTYNAWVHSICPGIGWSSSRALAAYVVCPSLTPTFTPTPTTAPTAGPIPTPTLAAWYKVGDASYWSLVSGRSNPLPSAPAITPIASESTSSRTVFNSSLTNRTDSQGVTLNYLDLGTGNTNRYSPNGNWYSSTQSAPNPESVNQYYRYIKDRKAPKLTTLNTLDETAINLVNSSGASFSLSDTTASLSTYDPSSDSLFVVIQNSAGTGLGDVTITPNASGVFNSNNVPLFVVANTITFAPTTTTANGTFIANTVNTGTSATAGLLINGNLKAARTFSQLRSIPNNQSPALFVQFNIGSFLKNLKLLGTRTYEWEVLE